MDLVSDSLRERVKVDLTVVEAVTLDPVCSSFPEHYLYPSPAYHLPLPSETLATILLQIVVGVKLFHVWQQTGMAVAVFVGVGFGARWRLIEETACSYTGYEDGNRVARRGLELHGVRLADADVGTLGQVRIGVGIPLLEGRRVVVDLVPQVRQTFGAVRTTHLEVGLRW